MYNKGNPRKATWGRKFGSFDSSSGTIHSWCGTVLKKRKGGAKRKKEIDLKRISTRDEPIDVFSNSTCTPASSFSSKEKQERRKKKLRKTYSRGFVMMRFAIYRCGLRKREGRIRGGFCVSARDVPTTLLYSSCVIYRLNVNGLVMSIRQFMFGESVIIGVIPACGEVLKRAKRLLRSKRRAEGDRNEGFSR